MYEHDKTEYAYKNGYEAGKKEAQAEIEKKDIEIDILIRKKDAAYDEIAKLKAEQDMAEGYADALEERAKSEAIKEFWDKLKRKQKWDVDLPNYILVADGDNLVKEMELGK